MKAEDHIKLVIGGLVFDNAVLQAKLEEANERELARESGTATQKVRQGAPSEEGSR